VDTITNSAFELLLISYFSDLNRNRNYELWYRIRILKFANLLHAQLGGDIDVICALVLLTKHTVRFFEFEDKVEEDISSVSTILKEINFPEDKTLFIIGNLQNDQAPVSVEEKIVNDAFILGGSGVIGLVRFITWNEYSGINSNSLLIRMDDVFKERLNKITTPQGLNLAAKENKFIYLFSALLQQEPFVESSYPGKYIILEGNSGAGKNQQAELLKTYFEKKGMAVTVVQEPTQSYKDFETYIEAETKIDLADSAPIFRLYSIIGDRHNQIYDKVKQALIEGNIVISIRSYISMLVYQCENEFDRLYVNFIHQFVPRPNIVILYDTTEEICLQRVVERGTSMSLFDKLESLKKFRPIFLDIVKSYYFDFPVEIVDASGTIEQVADDTVNVVAKYT